MALTQRFLSKVFDKRNLTFRVSWEVSGIQDGVEESVESGDFDHDNRFIIVWRLEFKTRVGQLPQLSLVPEQEKANSVFDYDLTISTGPTGDTMIRPKGIFDGKRITIDVPKNGESMVFNLILTYPKNAIVLLPVANRQHFTVDTEKTKQLFCDVKFKVEGRIFQAHRSTLCRMSPVFLKMFTTDMKDAKAAEPIEIEDATSEGFEAFLDMAYGIKSSPDLSICLEILQLADKYDITTLKHFMEYKLMDMISDETVIRILIAADMNQAEDLVLAAMDTLKFKAVEKLADFKILLSVEHEELLQDLLAFRPVKSEQI